MKCPVLYMKCFFCMKYPPKKRLFINCPFSENCISMSASLSMKCPVYGMHLLNVWLWNLLSMKCLTVNACLWNMLSMKMSCPWNFMSMKCTAYKCLWNVLLINVYELSCLRNITIPPYSPGFNGNKCCWIWVQIVCKPVTSVAMNLSGEG